MRGHHVGLDYHRGMLDDPWRMQAYDRAIRELVKPGDVVLDLGCGTGILSMLAARRGARVHAVESADIIDLARRLVEANGLADRVTFHHADAVELSPVEDVDWVVSDFMGRFVVDDAMLDAMEAAARWLRPTGRFIPGQVRLWVGPVGDFAVPMVTRWQTPLLGLDLSAGLQPSLNTCYRTQLGASVVMAPAQEHACLEVGQPVDFSSSHRFVCSRAGEFVGFLGHFSATLSPSVTLSTAPGYQTHWGQYLFPVAPRRLEAGAELSLELRFDGLQWHWSGEVDGAEFHSSSTTTYPAEQVDSPAWSPDRGLALEASNSGAATYAEGKLAEAAALFEQAAALLGPEDDDIAPMVYENLGLAYLNTGRPPDAVQALLRGEGGVQAQAAREWLRLALVHAGRNIDAERVESEG